MKSTVSKKDAFFIAVFCLIFYITNLMATRYSLCREPSRTILLQKQSYVRPFLQCKDSKLVRNSIQKTEKSDEKSHFHYIFLNFGPKHIFFSHTCPASAPKSPIPTRNPFGNNRGSVLSYLTNFCEYLTLFATTFCSLVALFLTTFRCKITLPCARRRIASASMPIRRTSLSDRFPILFRIIIQLFPISFQDGILQCLRYK